MLISDASFRADPAERLTGPDERPRASLLSLTLALFAASALHVLVLALIVYESSWEPDPAQQEREIPVEIVVEPPPPPSQPPELEQKKPEPPPPPEYEKPATDAPRAATKENVDRDGPVKPEAAPKPQPTRAPASPPPTPAAEQGPQRDGASEARRLTAEPASNKPDAEILPPRQNTPGKSAEEQARAENNIEQPTPSRPTAKAQQFPTFAALPDIDFGSAAKQTSIAGGNAKSTYLSVLYAMVVPHLRKPPGGRANASARRGTIDFVVDALGNLTYRHIGRSSGLPDLDEAALDALGEAAPFPPPPQGHRVGLTFTFGEK